MFGIPDFGIWSAYLLCILSAAACVVYGLYNWNKGKETETNEVEEEMKWEKAENEI